MIDYFFSLLRKANSHLQIIFLFFCVSNGAAIAEVTCVGESFFSLDCWKDATKKLANVSKQICSDRSYMHNCVGRKTVLRGYVYIGEFKNNKRHGFGNYKQYGAYVTTGEWSNGRLEGEGIWWKWKREGSQAAGSIYEGIWESGKLVDDYKLPKTSRTKQFYNEYFIRLQKRREELRTKEKDRHLFSQKRVTKEPDKKQKVERPKKKKATQQSGGTGSGFFVSKLGHIVTNEHVVRRCSSITVGDSGSKQVKATLLEKDQRNDLALLRISSTQMTSADSKSLISKLGVAVKITTPDVPLAAKGLLRPDDVELGEDILVAGYPYGEIFSDTIKVTKGIVSANKGVGDDSSQFQLDAAVQAGNSGGPIYDEKGNIVGVVVQQLNKLKVAKVMGSLPENVNFGIKASTVRQFLTTAGLPTKWSTRSKKQSTKELAKIAKNQTVMVVCKP